MSGSAAGSSTDAAAAMPPEPPKLRHKPQRRGNHGSNIGDGKLYADEAAFDADVKVWELEREEHKEKMKTWRALKDKLRDRSKRQRDSETETDSERRVRERREDEAQAAAHADRERARQAGRRQLPRLEHQQAWAADVAIFAGVLKSAAPRQHRLAYYGHQVSAPARLLRPGRPQAQRLAARGRADPRAA